MFYGTGDASERNITAFTISRDWFQPIHQRCRERRILLELRADSLKEDT